MNKGFVYAYGWNHYYEKLLGIWTIKEQGFIFDRRVWAFCIFMIICVWLPQIATLIIVPGDMSAMIECLVTNVSYTLTIVKISLLQYRRKVVTSIIVGINEDWGKVWKEKELDVMLDIGRTSRFISLVSFGLTVLVIVEYMAVELWNMASDRGDPSIDPRLSDYFLFDVYYPFDTTRFSVFVSVWFCQAFSMMSGAMCCAAPDCLASMLVLHVCGQLKIIRDSLENVVNEARTMESRNYWKKLALIVERHEQINEVAVAIRDTFSFVLLVQMITCSVAFCLQSFLIFTAFVDRNSIPISVLELGFTVIYAFYTLTHLFIYCYVGDKLFIESTTLANSFYKAKWYNLPPKEAKAFLHVCQRTSIPLEITAGKFCSFNFQLFNAVLKNSMGYFSMLIALKERLVD